jgi:prepilin-type N-terminal cleavage/methylation domain-containing protein
VRRPARGFTLLEIMVVVAIVGVITYLAVASWRALHARTALSDAAMEIQSTLRQARQEALANGRDTAVLFYPQQVTGYGARGRVISVLDGDGGFMDGTNAAGWTFCVYDPVKQTSGPHSKILNTQELPRGVTFGPPTAAIGVDFPFTNVPLPTATGCTFCGAGLVSGAIRFDMRGQATFYSTCGAALNAPNGASIALNSTADASASIRGSSIIMVLPSGLVRSYHGSGTP